MARPGGPVNADVAPGATATFEAVAEPALPMVATVEPDADKDGYGDVTQDLCPQVASMQTACPVVVLDSYGVPQGTKILVIIRTSTQAQVQVTGSAKVNGKTVKLTSKAKTVSPGSFGKFKVKLPKALKDALAGLPSTKSIKVKLVATSTDTAGRIATDKSSVKLPGTR